MTDPIRIEALTVRYGRALACADVSLSVAPGAVYALLGHEGSGKSSLVRCILGNLKPAAGRALVFGEDPRKKRRRLASRVGTSPSTSGEFPELLVLDEPSPGYAFSKDPGRTTFIATRDPALVEGIATHVGILRKGRLALELPIAEIGSGFRRIHYANRMTETRTAFGTELDAFDAVRVRVRGWGIEAVVSNFAPEAFERFREIDGVEDARAEVMSLSEIFIAVAGEAKPG
jgi:ABC-type multidrug transport system ATPase subunit